MNVTLTPPAVTRPARALPIRHSDSGLLVGPVLIGEPEVRQLVQVITTGGARRIPGYNGVLLVRREPGGQTDVIARAERLLSPHCGPVWEYTSATGPVHLIRAIHSAPSQELRGTVPVGITPDGLLLGAQHLPVNRLLAGRLNGLIRDLRDPDSLPLDARWYDTFDVTTCGSEALIETGEQAFLVQRDQLAWALEQHLTGGAS